MTDAVITLIKLEQTASDIGTPIVTPSSKEIYCTVESVNRREFFEAGRSGLNPELKFTIFRGDYNGELLIEYEGKQYGVYRSYLISSSDYVELYCERKAKYNGQQANSD